MKYSLKIILIVLITNLYAIELIAQDTAAVFLPPDEKEIDLVPTKFSKNEFGLSFDPILIGLLGGGIQNNNTRLALTYRRHLNEKWSFRLVGALITDMNYTDDYSNSYEVYNSDSSEKYNYFTGEDHDRGYAVNAGLQFNWGKKKLKWFTGMDLVYHRFTKRQFTFKYTYIKDTLNSTYSINDFENINSWEHIGDHIGVFPFIGIRAMFSKHWGFTTHFGISFEFGFEKYTNTYYYSTPPVINISRSTSFNIDSYALFQDVSLVFRF